MKEVIKTKNFLLDYIYGKMSLDEAVHSIVTEFVEQLNEELLEKNDSN